MSAIHQLTAGYTGRDAISNEARELRDLFRAWGFASEIFSNPDHIPNELKSDAHNIDSLQPASDDVLLLHLSAGSPVNERFPHLGGRKVTLYHNLTPAAYFYGINPDLAAELAQGREQVRSLSGAAEIVLADSRFNAAELEGMGYRDVHVFPLLLNFDDLATEIDQATVEKYRDGDVNVLFVGRCAPNKAIDDALRAFGVFQHETEPHSRFLQVGSWAGTELYRDVLRAQAREKNIAQVEILGTQPQDKLNALYATADIFLCMSEHEGFCIPLLEAMARDIPVIAYAAGAVEETLDGAGVLIRDKDSGLVAELMGRIIHDRDLRESILAGQRARIERYRDGQLGDRLRSLLSPVLPREV